MVLYLILVIGMSVYDILYLSKKGWSKDIYVLAGGMVCAAIIGIVYFSDKFRPSIASYVLTFFNVKE